MKNISPQVAKAVSGSTLIHITNEPFINGCFEWHRPMQLYDGGILLGNGIYNLLTNTRD